jgi:hypothetical protein
MFIQEKIVVALVILAALIFLWRHFFAKSQKSDSPCGGCGCGARFEEKGKEKKMGMRNRK